MKRLISILLFLNIFLLLNCGIQYRNDKSAVNTKFSSVTPFQSKPSVAIFLRLGERNRYLINKRYEITKIIDSTEDAYIKSGLFSSVRVVEPNSGSKRFKADFISEVIIDSSYDVSCSSCCTLGSLYVIPSKGKKSIFNITTIKDRKGGFIKTYKNSGSYTVWHGIVFIPLNPFFKLHDELDKEIYFDTNLDILRQLYEDRFTMINI